MRLLVRIFYDNYTPESDNQQKSAKNVKGSAVIVLDALTRFVYISSKVATVVSRLFFEVIRFVE